MNSGGTPSGLGGRISRLKPFTRTNLLNSQFTAMVLCVVGDDDQSLYRFRGATVDLFRDFESRYLARFGHPPEKFLSTNYRSTKNIIEFVDQYANLDRLSNGSNCWKTKLETWSKCEDGCSILGMFRDSIEELSLDLSKFLHNVFGEMESKSKVLEK